MRSSKLYNNEYVLIICNNIVYPLQVYSKHNLLNYEAVILLMNIVIELLNGTLYIYI